jgi:hypothetical protein
MTDGNEPKPGDIISDDFPVFTAVDVAYKIGTDALCLIFSGKDVVSHKMVFCDRVEYQDFINYLVKTRDITWGDLLKEGDSL